MKTLARLVGVGIVILAALQLVRPGIPEKAATAELQAPAEVSSVTLQLFLSNAPLATAWCGCA